MPDALGAVSLADGKIPWGRGDAIVEARGLQASKADNEANQRPPRNGLTIGLGRGFGFCLTVTNLAQGELRCEGRGAVIIRVAGKDYAVNGMASPRYPPIQVIWNRASYPEPDVDRLIVEGLTMCDW